MVAIFEIKVLNCVDIVVDAQPLVVEVVANRVRVALVGNGDRSGFKLRVVRRILGALDVGMLGTVRGHAAVPVTAVRNVFVGLRTLVCERWL